MFKKKILTTAALRAAGARVSKASERTTSSSSSSSSNTSNKKTLMKCNNDNTTKSTQMSNTSVLEPTSLRDSSLPKLESLQECHPSSRPSVFDLGKPHFSQEESFTRLIEVIKQATAPECDLDEVIQTSNNNSSNNTVDTTNEGNSNQVKSSCSATSNVGNTHLSTSQQTVNYKSFNTHASQSPHEQSETVATPIVLTYRSFAASLTCPKKFYLLQYRPDLIPRTPIGEVVHFDDTVGFNELARRWDRLQFGSKATVISETNFDAAVRHTEETILNYFHTTYAALGEQAPSLTIHRPAFAAPFGGHRLCDSTSKQHPNQSIRKSNAYSQNKKSLPQLYKTDEYQSIHHPLVLRARPTVLRFRPKDNQWVLLESQAISDPQGTSTKAAQSLQRMHFSTLAFRYWITQPHIPISLRKRFLNIDLDEITSENLKGHVLESSAEVASPIDLKRSGLLHIRQYFPGPATLLDCDPPRLVKFIQRLSLEDMIDYDERNRTGGNNYNHHGGVVFDLHHLESLDPAIWSAYHKLKDASGGDGSRGGGTNKVSRSQRQRDLLQHQRFELQQRLLESLIQFHTLKLVERAKDDKQVERWSTFSRETPDGLVHSTYAVLEEAEREQREDEMKARNAQNKLSSSNKRGKTRKDNNVSEENGKKDYNNDDYEDEKSSEEEEEEQQLEKEEQEERNRNNLYNNNNTNSSNRSNMSLTGNKSVRELNRLLPCIPIVPCFSENVSSYCSRGEVCPFFVEGMCLPQKVHNPIKVADNHVFTLPSSAVSRKVVWWAQGIRTIRDALYQYKKGNIKLTATQLRYVKAVSEGCVAVNRKEIVSFFNKIRYPVFIIDFEAVQFALPPFEKVTAYQSVPFQFSLDVFQEDILTETPTHYDFLHFGKGYSPNADPRKSCIAELMRIVKLERNKKKTAMTESGELARIEREAEEAEMAELNGGNNHNKNSSKNNNNNSNGKSRKGRVKKKEIKVTKNNPLEAPLNPYDGCFIAHFASYEKSCLEKLGQLEEVYKEDIKHFFFLDTMDLFKKGFIHPNAHGSNSLKKVLPAMCPDFQYGVFGNEEEMYNNETDNSSDGNGTHEGTSINFNDLSDNEGQQDEQRGDNAMGVYRLWYHQEGGSTIQELQRSQRLSRSPLNSFQFNTNASLYHSSSSAASNQKVGLPKSSLIPADLRERTWSLLRIQLLEYCSLDTRALYEIMREMWKEAEAVKDIPVQDKAGWVFVTPQAREITL